MTYLVEIKVGQIYEDDKFPGTYVKVVRIEDGVVYYQSCTKEGRIIEQLDN